MKSKGKRAWLITLEGDDTKTFKRCKVLTILRPQLDRRKFAFILPILFSSQYPYTLDEKTGSLTATGQDMFYKDVYISPHPEIWYGIFPHFYLRARLVKNLRCEENKKNNFEHTLYWTELAKFRPNPKYGEAGNPDAPDSDIQVVGEKEMKYTYSTRGPLSSGDNLIKIIYD